jgi:hypothetical protein
VNNVVSCISCQVLARYNNTRNSKAVNFFRYVSLMKFLALLNDKYRKQQIRFLGQNQLVLSAHFLFYLSNPVSNITYELVSWHVIELYWLQSYVADKATPALWRIFCKLISLIENNEPK